ncbi:MAG TPA: NnrS family protein [Gammaproteobacteria bacterium]|nr:NnrS family protein [Gammaproteobacteria bacterium]
MLNIDGSIDERNVNYGPPVWRLGFRPFFLGAGLFAIIAMAVWMASYIYGIEFAFAGLQPVQWHAHEMLFGYTMAVVAGFLLTAIKNWTGISVLRGLPLAALFSLWLIARLLPLSGLDVSLSLVAVFDVGFIVLLTLACMRPVLMVKQYKQVGIISKLFLLALSDLVFYLGVGGVLAEGVQWGLYSALYMIIALVLVMMRRVVPMFIKNGIEGEYEAVNRTWLDISSLALLLVLWLLDVFTGYQQAVAITALVLALLHLIRFAGWYTNRIWSKPLVWVLMAAYGFIILGFALKAASYYLGTTVFLSIHAFTVGGIGVLTVGMMSRVSLGHTGRNVFEPPGIVFWIFASVFLGAIVRVLFPLFAMPQYVYWIAISQVLWMLGFAIFVYVYAPMLLAARVDGRDG